MDNLIDLDKDYGYKYTAINDKVSRDANRTLDHWRDRELDEPGDTALRNINDRISYESEYHDYKKNSVNSIKRIENMIGRDLSDDEMVKIYDILDNSTSYISYADEDEGEGYSGSTIYPGLADSGKKEKRILKLIASAIDSEIFDDFYEKLIGDTDLEEYTGKDSSYKKYHFYGDRAEKAFSDALAEKYGEVETKDEDKKESEPVDERDIEDILDFEKIFDSSKTA